jgi:hypothetical protein
VRCFIRTLQIVVPLRPAPRINRVHSAKIASLGLPAVYGRGGSAVSERESGGPLECGYSVVILV